MSESEKGCLGMWLYRSGEEWAIKESNPMHKPRAIPMIENTQDNERKNSVIFSLKNKADRLEQAFRVFQDLGVNLVYIESRKSVHRGSEYEIVIDIDCDTRTMEQIVKMLSREVAVINVAQCEDVGTILDQQNIATAPSFDFSAMDIPWFPRTINDLDQAQNVLMHGSDLDADHPGYNDPVYRKRRQEFAAITNNYRHGQSITKIEYTPEEIKTWGIIYRNLHQLYKQHACHEYLENWPKLIESCGYREDNIPQLQDVSDFLKRVTGFQLRPVTGYLSPRDFLAGLAFRVFNCTQYIRHSSNPFHTPEPDCCHELLGHVPLLANPVHAQFSQDLGLASLGASDDDIHKLATLYFFTEEFGLCKQDDAFKAYGAGLMSSISELKHAVEATEKILRFDPDVTCKQECVFNTFQNAYYYTDSIDEAKEKMRAFVNQIHRPFHLRYDPCTQSVEVFTDAQNIAVLVGKLRGDLCIVSNNAL